MKSTAFTRWTAMLLVTALLSAGITVPAAAKESKDTKGKEDSVVTFTAADKTKRTVYWNRGITPPAFPKTYRVGGSFGAQFRPESGWYDLELPEDDHREQIAVAANAMHWWLDQNRTAIDTYLSKNPVHPDHGDALADPAGVKTYLDPLKSTKIDDSKVFGYFAEHSGKELYAPDSYLDLFINGYELNRKQNDPDLFAPAGKKGGFFYPALDVITLTSREDGLKGLDAVSDSVLSYLEENWHMILSLREGEKTFRYVNLWGGEFDEQNLLTAVYLTSPSDGSGEEVPSMVRCPVRADKDGKVLMALEEGKDLTWDTLYFFSMGDGLLEEYAPPAPPQNDGLQGQPDGPVPPEWKETQYVWSQDLTACTATREKTADEKHVESAEAKVTSEKTKDPTDTEPGTMTYVATFSADWAKPQTRTADIPAAEVQWGPVTYTWTEDGTACKAIREKTDGSEHTELPATVIGKRTKEPTATEKGETTYTATFSEDWARTQEKVVADIPTVEVSWKETTYQWSEDGTACKAIREKTDGSEHMELPATVVGKRTKEPTCAEKGETTYTASFGADWATTQTKTVANLEKTDHEWGKVHYEWHEEGRKCKAIRTCTNDETHTQEIWATVTSEQTTAPTTSAMGKTTYTAKFAESWAETQTLTREDVPKLEDKWEKPTYIWSRDNKECRAQRVSKDDKSITQTAVANVTFVRTRKPTLTEMGETTYTASFKEGWAKDQKKTVADVPKLTGEEPDDGLWGEPTYEWSRDHSRCTASRAKKNDPSSVVMAYGKVTVQEVKAATCMEPGESVYTATFKEKWAKDQKETVKVTDGKHSLQPVAEVPASGASDGVKAHYVCSLCGKLFSDPEGTKEITQADLVIPKPTLSGSNAIVNGIPEKDNTIAITPDMLSKALKDNRGAKGVLLTVGDASVVYSRETVEDLLHDLKDSRKLVLYVGPTDYADGGMTTDQALAAQKNTAGTWYHVRLLDGKKELKAPCTVMIPYTPAGQGETRSYRLEEDGEFHRTTSQYANGYLAWNADTGFFLLSEQEPVAEKSSGKTGMIVWIVVLVISGLLFLGAGGFLLYRKYGGLREDDFESEPQLDHEARERIKYNNSRTAKAPAAAAAVKTAQKPAAPRAAAPAAPAAPRAPAAPAAPVHTQPANPASPYGAQTAHPGTEAPYAPEIPDTGYQGAFAAKEPVPGAYQGAFEARKPTMADKAVKSAHRAAKPKAPEAPEAEKPDELDELEQWLSDLDE